MNVEQNEQTFSQKNSLRAGFQSQVLWMTEFTDALDYSTTQPRAMELGRDY